MPPPPCRPRTWRARRWCRSRRSPSRRRTHPAGRVWSGVAGAAIVGATTVLPIAMPPLGVGTWFAAFPVAAGVGLVAVGAADPLHRVVARGALFIGAVAVVAVIAAIPTLTAFLSLAGALASPSTDRMFLLPGSAVGLTAGLAALALSLASFAALTWRDHAPTAAAAMPRHPTAHRFGARTVHSGRAAHAPHAPGAPRTPAVSSRGVGHPVDAASGGTSLGADPAESGCRSRSARDGSGSSAPGTRCSRSSRCCRCRASRCGRASHSDSSPPWPRARSSPPGCGRASAAARMPLVAGAHAAVRVRGGAVVARATDLTVWAGAAVVASIGVLALTVPRAGRFVHVGVGFAYALVVLATALARAGADPLVVVCLTTCAAGAVAIAVTFARRMPSREWYAVLVVTAVPFAIGVLQVVFERSGWTALSTAVIFGLALTLVTTTREGLGVVVRTLAAATLVPPSRSSAVCLGAQLLPMSGSPVVLPVIAAIVAGVLGLGRPDRRRARPPAAAGAGARRGTRGRGIRCSSPRRSPSRSRSCGRRPASHDPARARDPRRRVRRDRRSPRRAATHGRSPARRSPARCGAPGASPASPGSSPTCCRRPRRRGRRRGAHRTRSPRGGPVHRRAGDRGGAGADRARPGRTDAAHPGALGRRRRSPPGPWASWAPRGRWWRHPSSSRAASAPRVRRLRALRAPTLAVAIVAATAAAVQGVRWGTGLDPAPTDPVDRGGASRSA